MDEVGSEDEGRRQAPSPLYIVCAPHRRVGVTTTARLLGDWLLSRGLGFTGFDADPHEPRFKQLSPDLVSVADIGAVHGQIALFDGLLDARGRPGLVDVWSRSFRPFFELARQIGFFEEAAARGVAPTVFFLADESEESLDAAYGIVDRWPNLEFVAVANAGAAALGDDPRDALARFPATDTIEIRALDSLLSRAIEAHGFSLSGFAADPPEDMSIVLRAALRGWLAQAFQQFGALEMRRLLRDSPALR
ncbi:MAG: hypothetical protein JWN93_3736 [Hyphomicrobiales bacterium]|nr:hypothetical protein [Hyphomicrobiales bacterium]